MPDRSDILRLGISGATGRVGRLVMELAREDHRFTPHALPRGAGGECGEHAPPPSDVLIDFSTDDGCRAAIEASLLQGVPIVIGTTGLSPETCEQARSLAEHVPVAIVPNLSRGALLLRRLAALAARLAPTDWTFDLVETHRRDKRDAPSGTAIAIQDDSIGPDGTRRFENRIASVRTAEVVGEHRIRIVGLGEELVLEHRALDRSVFARGALEAAAWIVDRPAGLHRFESWLDGVADASQDCGEVGACPS